jgi:hypothetical protein
LSEDLPMSDLAARWSELLIKDVSPGERLIASADQAGSLLRPPATESEIQDVEVRLGRMLPSSYRDFLLVSNGAYGDNYGATVTWGDEPERAPAGSDVIGVGFLPVQDLQWLRDADPWYADLLADGPWGEQDLVTSDAQEPRNWSPFADGLLITTDKGPGTMLLIPYPGREDWQLWWIHKEVSGGYLSFRSFLEYEVNQREPVTTIAEVETLIEQGLRGHHPSTMRLARVVHPDAVPLLVAVCDKPGLGIQPIIGLGRIATPAAITALLALDTPAARLGLKTAATPEARDALVALGDVGALYELCDSRALELAAQRISSFDVQAGARQDITTAIWVLGDSGDDRYVPILTPLLGVDPEIRFSAAMALASLGAAEGAEHLALLLATPGFYHRQSAEAALKRFRRREPSQTQ